MTIIHVGVQTEGNWRSKEREEEKDVCNGCKITPSTLATFLKNKKQLVSAKESQKFHAKAKKMRRGQS